MSNTQNEATISPQRPSDILITEECVPNIEQNITAGERNTEQNTTPAQQAMTMKHKAEKEEMKKRVRTVRVCGP